MDAHVASRRIAYRLDHTGPRTFPYVTLCGAIALACTTVLHGPFFVVPAIGAVLAMGMAMANVLVALFAAQFAGEYRDQLTSLELENHLQAWQLRQLVPAEAARALDPGLPGGK